MDVPLNRGVFVLSLDTELAWGSAHGNSLERRKALFWQTRPCIDRLLALLEKYKIRATWAIVGHLFLDHCQAADGCKHPEIIRPKYGWYANDWFLPDPCSRLEDEPIWYGPDIVRKVMDCKVSQEIGCHTFSHMRIGEPGCSRECFISELRACIVEAEKLGLTLRSFVYPRNSVGHFDVLIEHGFIAYRGVAPSWSGRLPGVLSRIGHLLDTWLLSSPPVVLPVKENGIWNLPASYFYPSTHPLVSQISGRSRVRKSKLGLRQAVKKRRIFHLWFHPFNLAAEPDKLLGGLEEIFAEVCRYRDAGLIDNLTMGELANSLNSKIV